jgi:hypothetical protein
MTCALVYRGLGADLFPVHAGLRVNRRADLCQRVYRRQGDDLCPLRRGRT